MFVPVASKVGVVPPTGLLKASMSVMVTVEVATPSATTGLVPLIVDVAMAGAPAIKTTVPSALMTGVVIERTLLSAFVEVSVQVETPLRSPNEQAP